jgi:hypothetical protein
MLTLIRQNLKPVLLVLTIAICVAFGWFYVRYDTGADQQQPVYGMVYGEKLMQHDLDAARRHVRIAQDLQLPGFYEFTGVLGEGGIVSYAAALRILRREAERLGLAAGEAEVEAMVQELAPFQTAGKFDGDKFRLFAGSGADDGLMIQRFERGGMQMDFIKLNRMGMKIEDFYKVVADFVLFNRLKEVVGAGLPGPEFTAERMIAINGQKIDAKAVLFPLSRFKEGITPSDEEIAEFYEKEKSGRFMSELRKTVEYVAIAPNPVDKPAESPAAPAAEEGEAQSSAENEAEEAQATDTPEEGGPAPAPAATEAAGTPAPAAPEATPEAEAPAAEPEAPPAPANPPAEPEAESPDAARERARIAEKVHEQLSDGREFAAVATELGLELVTLGPVAMSELPAQLAGKSMLQSAIDRLTPDRPLAPPVRDGEVWYIVRLKEAIEPTPRPLDEVKEEIAREITETKAREAARAEAAKVLETLKTAIAGGQSFEDAVAAAGLEAESFPALDRRGAGERPLGRELVAALEWQKPGTLAAEPIDAGDNVLAAYLVARTIERNPEQAERVQSMRGFSRNQLRQAVFYEWWTTRVAEARFIDNTRASEES